MPVPSFMTILEGATLIDGTGGPVIHDAMLVLDGPGITYAGPRTDRFENIPALRSKHLGKFFIPGLIEAHTHAAFESDMMAYIKNGITTVRFAGLDPMMELRLKHAIASKDLPAPRILSCGPMIDQPPVAYPEWSNAVDNPTQAAIVAESLIVEHDLHSLIVTQRVTAPVMRAVIETAHRYGRSVVGQTWAVDGKEAADLGIDELHTSSRVYASRKYPPEQLAKYRTIPERLSLASRAWASIDWDATKPIIETMIDCKVCYCPMHVITQFQVGQGVAELKADADFRNLFGESEQVSFGEFNQRLQGSWTNEDLYFARVANDRRLEWIRRFHEMGGVLLAGTDMQFGGIMLHRELRNLESIGLSRLQVITAATGGCAKALHVEKDFGVLQKGLSADFVVLNSDPLTDLTALRDINCVYKCGKVMWSSVGSNQVEVSERVKQ
jgi:hypothetical protein